MSGENTQYHEHRWRTSKAFLIIVAVVSLFSGGPDCHHAAKL